MNAADLPIPAPLWPEQATPAIKAAQRLRTNDIEADSAALNASKPAIAAASILSIMRTADEADLLVVFHALHCLAQRSPNQHTECMAMVDDALQDVQSILQDELREQREHARAVEREEA